MKHPMQNIWDQRKIIANELARIYSCLPFKAVIKDNWIDIIHEIDEGSQEKINLLRASDEYLLKISGKFFTNHIKQKQ